jgi:Protein of unknown function (DUF3574)
MTRFAAVLVVLAVSACAPDRGACLLDSQRPMTVVELFFGRDIPGREPLSDREWSDFAESTIAKEFPDGFTVTDGDGEWRDPSSQSVTSERTKILIVAAPKSSELTSRVSRVRDAYSHLYRQTSVGVLAYDACGEF